MKIAKFTKTVLKINLAVGLVVGTAVGIYLYNTYQNLPPLVTVEDYKPSLVSEVYASGGEKVGEFYREEVRLLVPYEDIPPLFVKAFLAAEDDSFFEHHGLNYIGIMRAIWVNLTSGRKKQGASTITQQAARTISLSLKKTYERKIREVLMTLKMENNLSKEDILYLYLNQIYLGHGSYGIGAAAETYFRKSVKDLSLAEMSMIAGLPSSPERLNPIRHSDRAKVRQAYVLKRMVEEGFVTQEEADKAKNEILTVHTKKKYKRVGPHYVELVRQLLVDKVGEKALLEEGLRITLGMDYKAQQHAQKTVQNGLRQVDKRRGYRGPKKTINLAEQKAVDEFLLTSRDELIKKVTGTIEIAGDGTTKELGEFEEYHMRNKEGEIVDNIPPYIEKGDIIEGLVTKVDDTEDLVYVSFAEGIGIIPLEDFTWARDFNPDLYPGDYLKVKNPSKALSPGYVIDVRVVDKQYTPSGELSKYALLSLEQEPDLEGALLSVDMKNQNITALVGGYDYFASTPQHTNSKFNRAVQARRQTGSGFKPIVYATGLDSGMTPATPIMDAPIVYGSGTTSKVGNKYKIAKDNDAWKPKNYNGKFYGDVLMRTALKRSLNTPTIRILEKTGVSAAAEYSRRLGIFSPLNMDPSLALGSSGTTVYEINKAFSTFANKGRRVRPILITRVETHKGEKILENISLDERFRDQIAALDEEFEKKREEQEKALANYDSFLKGEYNPDEDDENASTRPRKPRNRFFFRNPDQLISKKTAYLITNMLEGVIAEPDGTGAKAKIGHPAAGKTGTSSGYFDAWFLGYTAHYSTTVWLGYDVEKPIGRGEAGGKAALPLWVDYMKYVHEDKEERPFDVPDGIVIASVDAKTGKAKSGAGSIRLPFVSGTQPGSKPMTYDEKIVEEKSFLKDNF